MLDKVRDHRIDELTATDLMLPLVALLSRRRRGRRLYSALVILNGSLSCCEGRHLLPIPTAAVIKCDVSSILSVAGTEVIVWWKSGEFIPGGRNRYWNKQIMPGKRATERGTRRRPSD